MVSRALPWLLLLVGFSAACRPRSPEPAPLRPAVALPGPWQLYGRVRMQNAGWAARAQLHWRQDEERYQVRLTGPFGSGSYAIAGDSRNMELTTPEGRVLRERHARALLRERLGESPPLKALRYWVRGLPAPGSPPAQPERDAKGRLSSWEQQGYRIQVSAYRRVSGHELPERLEVRKGAWRLELRIRKWLFP